MKYFLSLNKINLKKGLLRFIFSFIIKDKLIYALKRFYVLFLFLALKRKFLDTTKTFQLSNNFLNVLQSERKVSIYTLMRPAIKKV
jgi:hypothetical protein